MLSSRRYVYCSVCSKCPPSSRVLISASLAWVWWWDERSPAELAGTEKSYGIEQFTNTTARSPCWTKYDVRERKRKWLGHMLRRHDNTSLPNRHYWGRHRKAIEIEDNQGIPGRKRPRKRNMDSVTEVAYSWRKMETAAEDYRDMYSPWSCSTGSDKA